MDQLPFERLLEHNETAKIENPLRRIPENQLAAYIQNFFEDNCLEKVVDITTLLRGARLARDEEAFMAEHNIDGNAEGNAEGSLTPVEKAALDKEKHVTIWTETRELKIILLTCCVGSVLHGWTQGAINGANQAWPKALGLNQTAIFGPNTTSSVQNSTSSGSNSSFGGQNGTTSRLYSPSQDLWQFSATNAIVYFAASTVGAFLCDPLTHVFVGRRGAIFVAALFTFTASIGEGLVHSWQALFACRFLLGIGMGAKSSVIPVYESEISPARLRGQILTSWQTGTALGIAISGAIPLIVPLQSWRFTISSSFIPAFALLLLVFVGSESPRWLIKKKRYDEAFTVLTRLRGNPLLAARDLVLIRAQLQMETTLFRRTNQDVIVVENRIPYLDSQVYDQEIGLVGYARRITQLFTIPRVRRATLASFLVMTAQQLTGINVFAFLASSLFAYGKEIPSNESLWLFFVFGIANFCSSTVAYFYIDSKGRRWLLMLSLAAMFPLLLATAFSFSVGKGLVTVFLVLYTMAYSPGVGVVPFLYSSEIFPQILREVGMAWASSVCWMGAGILDLCVPALIHHLHGQKQLLCLFAGLDVVALCLVWLFVPGTERQIATMEEMNYVFGVATRQHVRYQVKEVAPWCIDHYVLRRKGFVPPLYRWHEEREDTNGNGDTHDAAEKNSAANTEDVAHTNGAATENEEDE